MDQLRRLAKIGLGGLGFVAYLWLAGVHYAGEVRKRKEARRRTRSQRPA